MADKLTALEEGNPANSRGSNVAASVNAIIDQIDETNRPLIVTNAEGDRLGQIFQDETYGLVLLAEDLDANRLPVTLVGSSVVVGGENALFRFNGAKGGNFLQLSEPVDVDGVLLFPLSATPLDVAIYSEEFTSTADTILNTSYQAVISGVTINEYQPDSSVASTSFQAVNTSNQSREINYYITVNGAAPTPDDEFTVTVPKKSGNVDGVAVISTNDTSTSLVNVGDTLSCEVKISSGSGVTVTGSGNNTTKLTITQNTSIQNEISANGDDIAEMQETLDHFVYKPDTNRLDADVSIKTVGYIGLNDSFQIDSGSDTIAFTNVDEMVSTYPVIGGFKDQSVVANQDITGLIKETVPRYTDDLFEFEPVGPVSPTGAVVYQTATTSFVSAVLFGLEVVVAETVAPTDILYYRQYRGSDDTGSQIVNQELMNLNLADGDLLEWWLTPPLKGSTGDVRFVELLIAPNGDLDNTRPLLVRPPISDPSRHWVKVKIRGYENEELGIRNRQFTMGTIDNIAVGNNAATPTYVTGWVLGAEASEDFQLITDGNGDEWIKNVGNKAFSMTGDSMWQTSQGAGNSAVISIWSERSLDDGATVTENPSSLRKISIRNNDEDSIPVPSSVNAWLPGESVRWAAFRSGGSVSISAPSELVNGGFLVTGLSVYWQLTEVQ